MQLNNTQTTHSCVSTATTAPRTGHNVAFYMYIAHLVYTANRDNQKKKPPLFLQQSNAKQGGTGTTKNTLQFRKECVQKHTPFRYSNYRKPPAAYQ